MLVQLEFDGSPYLGVFARATDAFSLVPPSLSKPILSELRDALEVEVHPLTVGGSQLLGSLVCVNGRGAVVADFVRDHELDRLRALDLEVARLPGRFNAAGNNVLANDQGALVNPDLPPEAVEVLEDVLDVPVESGTVAGLHTVGSAAVVTSRGGLCHPRTTDDELRHVEDLLGVQADIGTVNHGAPYIGAGLVANAHGAAIGRLTTGPELNRIEDALGYLDGEVP